MAWGRIAAPLAIIAIFLAVYLQRLPQLGFYSDDWAHLVEARVPAAALVRDWPFDFRPFEMLPWMLARPLWGTTTGWYYAALILVELAAALTLFALLRDLLHRTLLPLAAALLYAVYPADDSMFWLTSIHYRTAALFLLLGLYLLVGPRAGRRLPFIGALACCACCLAGNELYLGLALALPLCAALIPPARPVARLARAAPFLALIALYLAYRVWLGPHVLGLPDNKAANFRFSAANVATTELRGAGVVLFQSWQVAASETFGGLPAPTPRDARLLINGAPIANAGYGRVDAYACVLYLVALAIVLVAWPARKRPGAAWTAIQPGLILTALGVAGLLGGFAALAFSADLPTLNGIQSRVNAAFLAGVVWIVCASAIRWPYLRALLFCAAIALPVAAAAGHTARLGATYALGWQAQRRLWIVMKQQVPALQTGTFVLLVPADPAGDNAIAALQPWGLRAALTLLYPDAQIDGDILPLAEQATACTDHSDAWDGGMSAVYLTPRGLHPHFAGAPISTAHVLVLRYWGAPTGRIAVVRGAAELNHGACAVASHPDRISLRAQPEPPIP